MYDGTAARGGQRFTAAEDDCLREMARAGYTNAEIARELGRSVHAVVARAIATRVRLVAHARVTLHGIGYRPEEVVRKICLRCRRPFDAQSRVIFVCDLCHASEDWRMGTAAL